MDSSLVLSRATAKLGHLREAGVRHFGHEDSKAESVLDVILLEALPHGTVGAEHGPVVGHLDHSRLSRIRVVVLTPFAVIERETIDVVLRTPRAGTVGFSEGVKFLSKRIQGMPGRILETFQKR